MVNGILRASTARLGLLSTWTRGRAFLMVLVLEVLILVAYATAVVPVYGYQGYTYKSHGGLGLFVIVVSMTLGALPAIWLPRRIERPSHLILWLLEITVVCSTSAIVVVLPYRTIWERLGWTAWMVVALGITSLVLCLPDLRLPQPPVTPQTGLRLFWLGALAVIAALLATYGLPDLDFSLDTLYDRRLDLRETAETSSRILGYLFTWTQYVFAPMMLISGIVRKSFASVAYGVVVYMWIFQISGSRQVLGILPLIGLFWMLGRYKVRAPVLILGATGVLASGFIIYLLFGGGIGSLSLSLVAKRLFVVPAVLGVFYFDYFSGHSPALYRDSFGSLVSASPYPEDIQRVIGEVYLGGGGSNANVNVFADAFGQLWYAGLLIPLGLVVALWILDSVTRCLHFPAVMAVVALLSVAVLNTGFTVLLLTDGFLVMLAVFWVAGSGLLPSRQEALVAGVSE